MHNITAKEVIEQLGLTALPIEGGYFKINYRSEDSISAAGLPARYTSQRDIAGTIYFMETAEQFSAMHSLPSDEMYYYHIGAPMEMLLLYADGRGETRILGPDLATGQRPQILAPRDCWHGSRPLPGSQYDFSLASTCMAPAYEDGDAVFPQRDDLMQQYPQFGTLITALTRLKPHHV